MAPIHSELKLGKKINEGKTKEVHELLNYPGCVLMQSKDQITAGNAARKNIMEGKAAISNTTTSCVFQSLQESGMLPAGFMELRGQFGKNPPFGYQGQTLTDAELLLYTLGNYSMA